VDLLPAFSYPSPFPVIYALLGIPPQDESKLSGWFTALAAANVAGLSAYAEAANNMLTFLRELIAEKRRAPGEDLTSALVQVRDGGDQLTENELTAMLYLLFVAGHETTTSLITNGFLALLRNTDQLASVRLQPALVDSAVEEMLRYDSAVQATIAYFQALLAGHPDHTSSCTRWAATTTPRASRRPPSATTSGRSAWAHRPPSCRLPWPGDLHSSCFDTGIGR
jgi:cytochrome P450